MTRDVFILFLPGLFWLHCLALVDVAFKLFVGFILFLMFNVPFLRYLFFFHASFLQRAVVCFLYLLSVSFAYLSLSLYSPPFLSLYLSLYYLLLCLFVVSFFMKCPWYCFCCIYRFVCFVVSFVCFLPIYFVVCFLSLLSLTLYLFCFFPLAFTLSFSFFFLSLSLSLCFLLFIVFPSICFLPPYMSLYLSIFLLHFFSCCLCISLLLISLIYFLSFVLSISLAMPFLLHVFAPSF